MKTKEVIAINHFLQFSLPEIWDVTIDSSIVCT